jgi:thioredoxin reductase (NADPH)
LAGISLDNSGYIIVDEYKQTNIDGVFAGGDVSTTPVKQIITACSDGAISAMSISRYLAK